LFICFSFQIFSFWVVPFPCNIFTWHFEAKNNAFFLCSEKIWLTSSFFNWGSFLFILHLKNWKLTQWQDYFLWYLSDKVTLHYVFLFKFTLSIRIKMTQLYLKIFTVACSLVNSLTVAHSLIWLFNSCRFLYLTV
jgi:hypothetical protein